LGQATAALAFAGFIHALASAGWFVLRRNPAGQPARFVVGGAHAWSRNPRYLSLTIIYAGVALALGKAWPLVLVVLPCARHEPGGDSLRGSTPSRSL